MNCICLMKLQVPLLMQTAVSKPMKLFHILTQWGLVHSPAVVWWCNIKLSAEIAYLNHFLNPGLFQYYAKALFKRFLRTSPTVDLWKFYLTYVRFIVSEIMALQQGFWCNIEIYRCVNTLPSSHKAVSQAYKFVLNCIGQDKDSSEIWYDYIQFIKAGKVCGIPTLLVPVHVILDKYLLWMCDVRYVHRTLAEALARPERLRSDRKGGKQILISPLFYSSYIFYYWFRG